MVYQWRMGYSHATKADPQKVGDRLEMLRARSTDNLLTADVVLEDARKPRSVLNPLFEWDDAIAADQYRREQARDIIQNIVVTAEEDPEHREVRAFVNVTTEDADGKRNRGYTTIFVGMRDPLMREQIVDNAIRELNAWKNKYESYGELQDIFKAIDHCLLTPTE